MENENTPMELLPQSQGGRARAEKLSPEQRSDIARTAAEARWEKAAQHDPERAVFAKATHTGTIRLGAKEIECAVLEDGTRVLSRAGFVRAIGRKGKVKGGEQYEPESKLPIFLGADNLKPFIPSDITDNSNPVYFKHPKSRSVAMGYKAELLPAVCKVFMDARADHKLRDNQLHIAKECEILVHGFAKLGITGLIDEATGYQYVRDRLALQKILDAYIAKELAAWAKRFPDEFYQELFRLRRWEWKGMSVNRPSYVGKLTNDLVYQRLAPNILDELQKKNPKNELGHRASKHHQWLTTDVGHPALAQHIHALIALMRASSDWTGFYKMVERALPRKTGQLPLLLED